MTLERSRPLTRLLDLLSLERLDRDLFLGETGFGNGRLFGGLVAAQCVVAAGRTVPEGSLHSLHAYFLRPGRHALPLRLVVDRIRDGRTFTTRRVIALQGGEAILNLSASFARDEDGIAHQGPMPEAPDPETVPDWEDERAAALGGPAYRRRDGPVEVRVCDPDDLKGGRQEPRKRVWLRTRGRLPKDPLVHAALLVYASDRTLLSTAARPHALDRHRRMAASLDHAMWLHGPALFEDWVLYVSESPIARHARGLVLGAMFTPDGRRIASVAQEGLIRVRSSLKDRESPVAEPLLDDVE